MVHSCDLTIAFSLCPFVEWASKQWSLLQIEWCQARRSLYLYTFALVSAPNDGCRWTSLWIVPLLLSFWMMLVCQYLLSLSSCNELHIKAKERLPLLSINYNPTFLKFAILTMTICTIYCWPISSITLSMRVSIKFASYIFFDAFIDLWKTTFLLQCTKKLMMLILVGPIEESHISVIPYKSHYFLNDLIQSSSSATCSSRETPCISFGMRGWVSILAFWIDEIMLW